MAPPRPTARSSDKRPPSPTSADEFILDGPSNRPDPRFHAFRNDLADIALADRVIASHYADPLEKAATGDAVLRDGPSEAAVAIGAVTCGDRFLLLDDSLGWAWGYAGEKKMVGYVPSACLGS